MPPPPPDNNAGVMLQLQYANSSPALLQSASHPASPTSPGQRRGRASGSAADGWRSRRPGALRSAGDDVPSVTSATLNSPVSLRVSWDRLNCTVKAGALTLNDRLVDRERNYDREAPNFSESMGRRHSSGVSLGGVGTVKPLAALRRSWTAGPDGIPLRAAKLVEKTVEVRHRFTPAPLPGDANSYSTLGGRQRSKHAPANEKKDKEMKPTARTSFTITKGCRLAQLIESGCIALVRSSYFEDCILHHRPFAMRQLIPNSFIWRGDEAMDLWWKNGKCFLVIVSYPWLSRDHPDPDQFHLKKLVRIIEEYKKIWNMHEVAVILDYCSLWQRSARGDTRTAEQKEQFYYGMLELNIPFVHKAVTSIKLTEVPKGEVRKYDDRGWTLLESIMIDSKGGDWNRWTFGELDPDSQQWSDPVVFFMQAKAHKLRPPLTVEGFNHELEQRRIRLRPHDMPLFSNEKDDEEVPKRYEEFLMELEQASTLSYDSADWSDEDVCSLLEVAKSCKCLEKLTLNNNRITLKGASELAKLFPQLPSLQYLSLKNNPLCQDNQATDLLKLVWSKEKKPARNLVIVS